MKIVIDIPKSLYANLQKIQNGSIAAKRILECVRNGKSVMYYPQVEGITPTVVEPNTDCVSKQAAIDTLLEEVRLVDGYYVENDEVIDKDDAIEAIRLLPSAQTEQLTDNEQRIFLAAMGREEKICKEVDDECIDCREPYEDSLVRTCHEIIRKVRGALWT